jgi:hypothetical protein
MAMTETRAQVALARLAALLIIGLAVLGLIWYGVSRDVLQRIWQDLVERPGGPMTFRFILQPIMAAVAALLDGIKDAQTGRSPYFWSVLHEPAERRARLHEGLISTARILLLALAMDTIYQLTVQGQFYPGEAVIIAILLAFIPYLLLRGPFARVARWWMGRPSARL